MQKDYYIVLGVSRGADTNKIKKAYRRIAKEQHPDASGTETTSEKFMEIKNAYETLSDDSRRQAYDRELARQHSPLRINRAPELIRRRRSAYRKMDSYRSAADEFFEGLVSGFFPDYFEKSRPRGKDLYLEVILSEAEAFQGGLFPLSLPVLEPCPRCGASGFEDYFFCPGCYGRGRVRTERQFSLSIPPHVRHGTHIRLSLEDIGLRNVSIDVVVLIDPAADEQW